MLVVSCPCAFILATPTAMVAALSAAARLGILIKQTNYLEQSAHIDAVVMDKTGTITTGKFEVAKPLLDDALLTVRGIYGKDPDARKARGYFTKEERKTFIGEPYERVMAYYYRGLDGNEYERLGAAMILGNSLLTAHHVPVACEYEVKNAQPWDGPLPACARS